MEHNKVLLFIVLIILIALVSLNFKNISGNIVGGDVNIDVSPSVVDCRREDNSKVVNVFVDAGSIGVDKKFYLHRSDGTRVGGSSDNLCSGSICTGMHSKNYRFDCSLGSGNYFFKFTRDNYDLEFESPIFTLRHSG